MTFTELVAELVARGAQDDDARNGRWINLAYQEIANTFDWPFTVDDATGTADAGSVALSDMRKVIIVGDVSAVASGATPGRRLYKITSTELTEDLLVEDLTTAGSPDFWYWDPVNSEVKAYPVGGTIYAKYHKRLAALSGSTEPVFAEQYHTLIVDRAMAEMYADDDQLDMADQIMQKFNRDLGRMADDYEVNSREHSYIQVVNPYDG